MTITHHLDDATLMSFAAGSLPATLSVVAASHIASCAHCARELRYMERVGAAMFANLGSSALGRPAPTMALARAEADAHGIDDTAAGPVGDLPAPLAALVGPNLADIKWKRLGLGVLHHRLHLADKSAGDLRLLNISPGRQMPNHGHGGSELTLIIGGAYADKTGVYNIGDVADLGDDVDHTPIADPVLGCICIVASDRPARFSGIVQRIMQPLTGM